MERSEVVRERIKRTWPADIPLPEVFFGLPVASVQWALELNDEQYDRAKSILAELRRDLPEQFDSEVG
jgi:hypothetical protein